MIKVENSTFVQFLTTGQRQPGLNLKYIPILFYLAEFVIPSMFSRSPGLPRSVFFSLYTVYFFFPPTHADGVSKAVRSEHDAGF